MTVRYRELALSDLGGTDLPNVPSLHASGKRMRYSLIVTGAAPPRAGLLNMTSSGSTASVAIIKSL